MMHISEFDKFKDYINVIEQKKILVICEPSALKVRYMLFKELMPDAECIERNDYYRLTTPTHRIDFCLYHQTSKGGRRDQILNTDHNTPLEISNEVIMPMDQWRYGEGAYGTYKKKKKE